MAKTLNQFLEGYLKVKSADEQKFVDKHVTVKNPDRNGNGDDVFKGSTKTIDRRKDRKGYNPGEDEKVYEALKGSQHKIDANKNGKLDAHDFKLLRAKKKVAEAAEDLEELSNATLGSYERKSAPDRNRDAGNVMAKRKQLGTNKVKVASTEMNKARPKFEETEQIDELSKKTLGSYVKKAGVNRTHIAGKQKSVDDAMTGVSAAMRYVSDTDNLDKSRKQLKKVSNRLDNKDFNRQQGISKAVDRLTKEEAEGLDELSTKSLEKYKNAARADAYDADNVDDDPRFRKRAKGIMAATKKIRSNFVKGVDEEVEDLDELSRGTLGRYSMKTKSIADNEGGKDRSKGRELAGRKRWGGSVTGVEKAKVMATEEVDLDEKLSAKAPMGTYIKDFQKSNAPQFKGRSPEKRRVMAIAAKLSAERGGKPLNKEERLQNRLTDISESHQRVMLEVFEKLSEDNKSKFLEACDTPEGVEQMLDFAINNRGE